VIGPIVKMHETPASVTRSSPALGQRNDEILAQRGFSAAETESLRQVASSAEPAIWRRPPDWRWSNLCHGDRERKRKTVIENPSCRMLDATMSDRPARGGAFEEF
jgi:hypothetical protein